MAVRHGAGSGPPRTQSPLSSADGGGDTAALREAWERLHRASAPGALSPDFLRRDIAYRQQADRHGGLSAAVRRRLAALASSDEGQPAQSRSLASRVKPGSTLLREWHGRTYTVLVLEDGFEMAGERFASLSEVARRITSAHWSGPRFFGLRRAGGTSPRRASASARDA